MWWRAYFAVILGGIFISLTTGIFLWARSDPSTTTIDQDLALIGHELKAASDEEAKYSGGMVLGLVQARSEILRLTRSMLQAKKLSWLRRVNLTFTVEGQKVQSLPDKLVEIQTELDESARRIAEAEADAQQYTGGLVQGLALAKVATERITQSHLLLAYYSAKYGLPVPPVPLRDNATEQKQEPPAQNVVKDAEGL